MCHIDYDEQIIRLNHTLYEFEKEHTELDLFIFPEILEKSRINFGGDSMVTMDVSSLDGRTILAILWLTNAAFNFAAKDYRAFCINLLYVVCLLTLGVAAFRQEKDIVQGMIGGSEKILLFEAIILLYRKSFPLKKQHCFRRCECFPARSALI